MVLRQVPAPKVSPGDGEELGIRVGSSARIHHRQPSHYDLLVFRHRSSVPSPRLLEGDYVGGMWRIARDGQSMLIAT